MLVLLRVVSLDTPSHHGFFLGWLPNLVSYGNSRWDAEL